MLNPKQLAEKLNLSLSMVYKLLSSGQIECYRIGSAYRTSEEQLKNYLERVKNEVKQIRRAKHF